MATLPETLGAVALRGRLERAGRTAELAIVDVVLDALRKHPAGDEGLTEFTIALAEAAEKLNADHKRQVALDDLD